MRNHENMKYFYHCIPEDPNCMPFKLWCNCFNSEHVNFISKTTRAMNPATDYETYNNNSSQPIPGCCVCFIDCKLNC
jgi:hypothetical protein